LTKDKRFVTARIIRLLYPVSDEMDLGPVVKAHNYMVRTGLKSKDYSGDEDKYMSDLESTSDRFKLTYPQKSVLIKLTGSKAAPKEEASPKWEKELNSAVFSVAKGFSEGFKKGMQF